MTSSQQSIVIEPSPDGGDPLVQAYLSRNRSCCAFRIFSWGWLVIGALACLMGGLLANLLFAPLPIPLEPDETVEPLVLIVADAWFGDVTWSVLGMIGGGLLAAMAGRVIRSRGISAAHEPLLMIPVVVLPYLASRDHLVAALAITGLLSLIYFGAIVFRLMALTVSGQTHGHHEDDLHEPEGGWPVYTVLLPLYRETEVASKILTNIQALDYPADKLDVKFMLEADDPATREAIESAELPPYVEVVVAPDAQPKTKPRACNHGLVRARGEFLVIYDAEDRPQPDQLKQSVLAYRHLVNQPRTRRHVMGLIGWLLVALGLTGIGLAMFGPAGDLLLHVTQRLSVGLVSLAVLVVGSLVEHQARARGAVACLQAQLAYHNHSQNLLTRWFALEYNVWFQRYLPGLVRLGGPIPLGGTSNHFRTDVLRQLDGWDPFNVTEDCDLGIRLYMAGYRTEMLDSVTWEEANSRVGNWLRQRSRWIKGYLVTHFVWCRRPLAVLGRFGPWGAFAFIVSIFGVGGLSVLNLVLWLAMLVYVVLLSVDMMHGYGLWELLSSAADRPLEHARLSWQMVYYGADQDPLWSGLSVFFAITSAVLLMANVLFVLINLIFGRRPGQRGLVLAALLSPLYWVLISLGAWKGLWQLVFKPHYWEKTVHGLDHDPGAGEE